MCEPLPIVFAEELFLGHDLLAWLVLAFGGALVVGNVAAVLRPPPGQNGSGADEEIDPRALRRRALIYAVIGAIAAVWALATLLTD